MSRGAAKDSFEPAALMAPATHNHSLRLWLLPNRNNREASALSLRERHLSY